MTVPHSTGTRPRPDSRDRSVPHRSTPWPRERYASAWSPVSPPPVPQRDLSDHASRMVEAFIRIFLFLNRSTANRVDHRTRPDVPYSKTAVFADVKPIQPCDATSPCRPTIEAVSYEPAQR